MTDTPRELPGRPAGGARAAVRRLSRLSAVGLALAAAGCASASARPASPSPSAGPQQSARGGNGNGSGPVAYDKAIPEGAVADSGLFLIHRTDEKLLFELPDSLLGRDMLLISRIARVPANLGGYIPAGTAAQEQVVRWEREGNRVLLRKVSYDQVAADSLPISLSVVSNNFAPIVQAFPVKAFGADSSVVLDVTDLFGKDVPAISGLSQGQRTEYGVRRLDEGRSFVNYARSYPLNVDVRHTMTYDASKPPSNSHTGTLSMEMHQSMVLLPAEPMRPRHRDPRVGFFGVEQVNYGLPAQKAATQSFIARWRLEPSDPAAYARGEPVEPVKPIVYYLDPATPAEWRGCVKQGVEDWQGPFETAGFRDAIVARDAPDPDVDPEWSAEDVRNSVVRWAASETRNAQGPSVVDPRSGEIIESDIVWYHNHLRSYRNRLMLETGAANPLARSLPVDQTLMCEAMRAVIAHEVGHALGLPHNMAASSAYPVDSLRSADFVRRMGIAPTIMDYARQNYVAQPGDGLRGADFIRQIGPYDHWVINWGYRVLPEAATADEERPVLHRWVMEKAGDPVYRYTPQRAGMLVDPSAQTEDLGDDPVEASTLGIANLKRVAPNLVAWTGHGGEDYEDLDELYGELVFQWQRYVNHVLALVGGSYETLKTSDQAGAVYVPVPRAEQERAMAFFDRQVFDEAPTWLADPELLRRIEHAGGVERVQARQASVLNALLSPDRMQRLVEAEAVAPRAAYPLPEFLDDLRASVWSELRGARAVGLHRRALQRSYVERMRWLLEEEPRETPDSPWLWNTPVDMERSEIRPLARAQLRSLRTEAGAAARRTGDRVTRAHLQDVVARIDDILEGDE